MAPTSDPKHVAPTLVDAVKELARDDTRGFLFLASDGAERFCSWKAIHDEALQRGAHLRARGLAKGDRLAMVIPEGDEFVLSFLGAMFAGVVPVPIYPQLSFKNAKGYHDTVAHIARASGATALLTTEATRPFVEPALEGAPLVRDRFTVAVFAKPSPGALDAAASPGDLAFLQFTSGSTSRPKGVMVTHRNLAWNSEAFMIHGLRKDSSIDKGVTWLPLFHDMGLIGFVVGPIFTNVPVVFLPTSSFVRTPRLWLDTIHKHRGTITYAPNFAYALVTKRLKEKDVASLDLSCLTRAGCGAEPIQAKALTAFAEKLAPARFDPKALLPSYGMAEGTLALTFVPRETGVRVDRVSPASLQAGAPEPSGPGEEALEIVCCGATFPEHEIAIVGPSGERLEDRRVGEVMARGPSITQGYYEEPEMTAAAFRDGWLATGDLGYMVDGEVFICGRVKDMIIVRGKNFYPNDIEAAVSDLPNVRRGNVVAFSVEVDGDGKAGSGGEEQLVVCAEAFATEGAALTSAIASLVLEQFGLAVHRVELVAQGSLPRTSSGKLQRRKARELFLLGGLVRARAGQEES